MKKRALALIDLFLIFIILLFSFSIFGLQPLGGNNVIYIPFMEHLQNNSLFSQDLLLKTVKFHPTLFFNLIVSFSNFCHFSIKDLLTFLPWLIFYSQSIVIFLLAQLLFKNKKVSYLALIFLLSPKFSLAYESIGINLHQITPTSFVMPLGLLAIYFYLDKKEKLSFLLLGIISNFQPITSVQLMFLFTFSQFIMGFSKKRRLALIIKKLFLEYIFLFLGSFPILLVLTKGSSNFLEWIVTPNIWLEIVKMRTAHHFFPSTWQFSNWVIFASFLTLFYLSINFKKNM